MILIKSTLQNVYCLFVRFYLFLKLLFLLPVCFSIPWKISVHLYCVSDSSLQWNKNNSYWYGVQYQDRQTALGSWYRPVEMILPSPPTRAISFPLVRSMTLGQSVYSDIALYISNYHIITIIVIIQCYVQYGKICTSLYCIENPHGTRRRRRRVQYGFSIVVQYRKNNVRSHVLNGCFWLD